MSVPNASYLGYTKSLEETKILGDPSIGFTEIPTAAIGTATGFSTLYKQNNTIINLLISLHKKVDSLSRKTDVDELATELSKLTIKETPKVKAKTPLYVYKSPRLILEEERHKIGLPPTTSDWTWPVGHPFAPPPAKSKASTSSS
uniref:ORF2 n=1 Tax=Taro bacilliform virus TaxID=178354 RepID=A0A2P1EPR3_9VIRU|nr:ORF2 [Taro bacilliform virus]